MGLTSVTVISERAGDSDVLATALFVMGSDDGIRFAESLDDVEALFVAEDSPRELSGAFGSKAIASDSSIEQRSRVRRIVTDIAPKA